MGIVNSSCMLEVLAMGYIFMNVSNEEENEPFNKIIIDI